MISELFEKHCLFRRLTILIEFIILVYVIQLSFDYLIIATQARIATTDIVANMAALQAPVIILMRLTIKDYHESRTKNAVSSTVTD